MENTMLQVVKQEVCDNPDDRQQMEHNRFKSSSKIDQTMTDHATWLQNSEMKCSSGGVMDGGDRNNTPTFDNDYNTVPVHIKIEPQEPETDLVHEHMEPTPMESSALNDQELASNATCLANTKMEYPMGDDIDLEATKITPSCDTEYTNYADEQIKVEAEHPMSDQEQDISKDDLEPHESSSPASVNNSADDHSETHAEDFTRNRNKRVYADGVIFDIRVINDASGTEANNVPTEQPSNSKPATANGLSRHTAQIDVMQSIKALGENKQYKCDRCEKSFCDKMELKIHKRNHQFTVCPVCKRTMRTDFVKRHIARVHPDDGILPKNRSFPCDECDRVFSNDVQLKNHQLSHKKQGCPVCGKIVRSDYLKRHMDLNHPKEVNSSDGSTYQCDQCDTVLSNKYLLFFHKRTHQTEECPVCKETLRAGYMKIHIDMKHPDHSTLPENPAFKCDQCEKTFGYKAALTLHKRKHRLTECPVCKKTVRADCLKRHMDFNHPNETSLAENGTRLQCDPESGGPQLSNDRRAQQTEDCPECKETFRSDYLKIHIAMKHPNDSALPEDRPFRCDQCDKSFCYKTQLRLHKRNHRLTECTICQKSMRLDCLKLHMTRMHSNTVSSVSAPN